MKKILGKLVLTAVASAMFFSGCSGNKEKKELADAPIAGDQVQKDEEQNEPEDSEKEKVTILVAAAASLETAYKEKLIPLFQEKYPWITVEGTYDSSGKLQMQIEEGLEADIFMSAAMKQMRELEEKEYINKDSVTEVLENHIVLIVPSGLDTEIDAFEKIILAENIAIGAPESVPAGQYAKEALTNIGLWEEVNQKASFGTNVTEVLNWVAEGSADAGIVYATDAALTEDVKAVGKAPEGSLASKVIYPAGILSKTAYGEEAALFLEFLTSDEAIKIFEEYGFSAYIPE